MPRPPDYGIIYNWDGAPHYYSEVPQSIEDFVNKVYAPVEDTQIGAHFWCVGEHQSRWQSEVMELVGDVHDRKYVGAFEYIYNENVREMLERGEDPQAAVVERGHELGMHVYASVRMNDNHFEGAQIEDLPTLGSGELTRMRIEHSEWLLGDKTTEWFAISWNFEVPEVREHRYNHIKELCTLYDWDGVELDWQRHAFHLPQDDGYRLRYVLTDLQRAVRRMTDGLAEKRGRPFFVAARVAGSLEACRRIGYDVPTWIEEGLVDILIPAGGASTDPSIDVSGFAELCRGTDVLVYPGLDAQVPGSALGPEDVAHKDPMLNRAIASRHHRQGANGIYIFNWHADHGARRELLNQVGSLETLRGTDKIYAATHRYLQNEGPWRGAFHSDRPWGQVPVALKRTLTGDGPTISLEVADDIAAGASPSVVLRVRLEQWVRGDAVGVLWDGTELDPEVRYDIAIDTYANPLKAMVADVGTAVWLISELSPTQAQKGQHEAKVVLEKRHPKLDGDIVLTDVEVVITYPGE